MNGIAVDDREFDFVIIGGGTAGLALASRLTEDATTTVLVLEAGEANIGEPAILVPGQFGQSFMNPKFDWAFTTVKQKFSNGRELVWNRGKGLGGSSQLNFYAWSKPPAEDVDAIEKLGNPGWNWAEYIKYSKRSETFHPPSSPEPDAVPQEWDPSLRGSSGPIQTTIPFHHHQIDDAFLGTMGSLGFKRVRDPYGGNISGTWIANSNLDPKDWTRSYATTGYYLPVRDRPNLAVLTEATVARIVFDDAKEGAPLTARGVEYVLKDGRKRRVNAKKEVVLSAGTVKNPQILELSGIGRPEVLSKLEVETKIELMGVGENVQEHSFFGISYELVGSPPTHDLMRDPEYAAEAMKLYAQGLGPQRVGITGFSYFPLSAANPADTARLIDGVAASLPQDSTPGLKDQYDLQLAVLRDDKVPDLELVAFPGLMTALTPPEPGKTYVTMLSVLNHPFSRGTIHAKSTDPFDHPEIDPHYFENDFDLEILVQHFKFTRKLAQTEPFKSSVVGETCPGLGCASDEEIRDYIRNTHTTTWHTVGSCSMLPKEKQGVVDPELKVYGTTNLRIVDVSIIPLHIAAHTHATAYVIAEKAADIIRLRK